MTLNRSDLSNIMSGVETFESLAGSGKIAIEGDISILGQLAAMMDHFDPLFEIMPGTKAAPDTQAADDFTAEIGKTISE